MPGKYNSDFFHTINIPKDNNNGPIVMEQILSAIHGHKEKVSFEVWSFRGKIRFAFASNNPCFIKQLLESHYPGVSIHKKTDYAEKCIGKSVYISHLNLASVPIYPIRRYAQTSDWINRRWTNPWLSILPTLKNKNGDHRCIQITINPCSWQKRGNDTLAISEAVSSWWIFNRCWTLKEWFLKKVFSCWILRIILVHIVRKSMFSRIDHREHRKESSFESAQGKLSQLGFKVTIRVIYADKKQHAQRVLQEIASSFTQFNIDELNGFKTTKVSRNSKIIQKRKMTMPSILSLEELAGILVLPGNEVKIPELQRAAFKEVNDTSKNEGIVIGKTLENEIIQLPQDNLKHTVIFGRTGVGKSTFILNILRELIQQHKGVGILDPHGDLIDQVLNIIPKDRIKDTVLIDPSDTEYPIAFNVLKAESGRADQVASNLVDSFQKLFRSSWGPRTDYILSQAIAALVGKTSLLAVPRLLLDSQYRKNCLEHINDPVLLDFWEKEYQTMPARFKTEAIAPILNKVNRFLMVPVIRNILGQQENRIDLRKIMDSNKILLIKLPKGLLGEENSALLGSFFLAHLQLAALSRADIPIDKRQFFTLFVDELQHFTTSSVGHIATILSEGRKYRLNLVAACQHLSQLKELKDSIFGNVNNLVSFSVGHHDAQYISQYLHDIETDDLLNLPPYHGYLRIIKDIPRLVSFKNIPPVTNGKSWEHKIRDYSRSKYSRPRGDIEKEIREFFHAKLAII